MFQFPTMSFASIGNGDRAAREPYPLRAIIFFLSSPVDQNSNISPPDFSNLQKSTSLEYQASKPTSIESQSQIFDNPFDFNPVYTEKRSDDVSEQFVLTTTEVSNLNKIYFRDENADQVKPLIENIQLELDKPIVGIPLIWNANNFPSESTTKPCLTTTTTTAKPSTTTERPQNSKIKLPFVFHKRLPILSSSPEPYNCDTDQLGLPSYEKFINRLLFRI